MLYNLFLLISAIFFFNVLSSRRINFKLKLFRIQRANNFIIEILIFLADSNYLIHLQITAIILSTEIDLIIKRHKIKWCIYSLFLILLLIYLFFPAWILVFVNSYIHWFISFFFKRWLWINSGIFLFWG